MFGFRAWIRSFGSRRQTTRPTEEEHFQADKASTASTEPTVRAVRKPYQDSPERSEFFKMHVGYGNAPMIRIDLELVGAAGIGKNSLVNKLLYDDMNGGQRQWWADHLMEWQRCHYYCGGKIYDVDVFPRPYPALWNAESDDLTTKSQLILERSRNQNRQGYGDRKTHRSIVFAYDTASKKSFDELVLRYDHLQEYYNRTSSVSPITILGLQSDVDGERRQVTEAELRSFATSRGCLWGECSARSGQGVGEAFSHIVEVVHTLRVDMEANPGTNPSRR